MGLVQRIALAVFCLTIAASSPAPSFAWGNGGKSKKIEDPNYGTHDWIAEEAARMLPSENNWWIMQNFALYLLGTEAPDNRAIATRILGRKQSKGYGDMPSHHIYPLKDGTFADDSAARRAQEEREKARAALRQGNFAMAAFYAGAFTHYGADAANWAHELQYEAGTHAEFERSVESTIPARRMSDPDHRSTIFQGFVHFDGDLETITGREATVRIARRTFEGGRYTPEEMEALIPMGEGGNGGGVDCDDWSPAYVAETGEALNFAINTIAAALNTLSEEVRPSNPSDIMLTTQSAATPSLDTQLLAEEGELPVRE